MERSITVLLPVRDAESSLIETVDTVLDIAADMSDLFELLIIDDGSKDATNEVALQLATHYPQVRTLRHAIPQGRDAALRSGMSQSRGDAIFVVDPGRNALSPIKRTPRMTRPNYLGRSRTFIREGV